MGFDTFGRRATRCRDKHSPRVFGRYSSQPPSLLVLEIAMHFTCTCGCEPLVFVVSTQQKPPWLLRRDGSYLLLSSVVTIASLEKTKRKNY